MATNEILLKTLNLFHTRQKNIVKKGENAVTSMFSISHDDFRRQLSGGVKSRYCRAKS